MSILGEKLTELGDILKNRKKPKVKQVYADTVVRNAEGDILLLQRSYQDDFMQGKWSLAGGKVESGEKMEAAALRELQEETGIVFKDLRNFNFLKTVDKDDCTIHYFNAELLSDDTLIILDNEEHYRYEFAKVDKLNRYDMILDLEEIITKQLFPLLSPFIHITERMLTPEELPLEFALDGYLPPSDINKSFDEGLISDEDYLLYMQRNEAMDTIKKGYDQGLVSEEKFFDVLEKSKHYEFVKVVRDNKSFYQYREVGSDVLDEDIEEGSVVNTNELLDLKVTKYSDKSILITGNTYKNLQLLRQAKEAAGGLGVWNKTLNGWVFPLSQKDAVIGVLASKMSLDTFDETVAHEAAIDLKNSVDIGTTVVVGDLGLEVKEIETNEEGKVEYTVETDAEVITVTEEEIAIPPADDKKAEELINNATEVNRFKTGKELFGKEAGEKPVSDEIEKEGLKDMNIEVKEFTTRSGAKINALDFSNVIPSDIQLFNQDAILDKPKPYWIPDVNEKAFVSRSYSFNYIKQGEDKLLIELNGTDSYSTYSGGTKTNLKADFAVVSTEQLVAILDYYKKKKKAELEEENITYLKKRAESLREWDKEKIDSYKVFDYSRLSTGQKKKYPEEKWNQLSLDEKIAELPFMKQPYFKGSSTRVSSLKDGRIPYSYFRMYSKFVDANDKGVSGRYLNGAANSVVEYNEIREEMGFKTIDLETQKEENDSSYVKGRETSYGDSNTKDDLLDTHGVKVKRQNGDEISTEEIGEIKNALNSVFSSFGDRSSMSKGFGLKISHSGDKLMHARKAAGLYYPSQRAIGVSNNRNFGFTLAHEYAHFIDNYLGKQQGRHYSSDNYNSLAGQIAKTFRKNVNKKTDSDYYNRTCECFARALEQYHAMKTDGDEALIWEDKTYHENANHVHKDKFNAEIKPLIEQFLKENDHLLKAAINQLNIVELNNSYELIKSSFDKGQIDADTWLKYDQAYNDIIKAKDSVAKDNKDDKKVINKELVPHSKAVLKAFAKETSAAELKRIINESHDEKLRKAAHEELDRRERLEKIKKKKK